MRYYIGTSGYHYDDWVGKYYPEDLSKKEWLGYYARNFETLEINSTFYNIPKKESFKFWHDHTPSKFKFSIKGSRYVTHMKKLNEPGKGVKNLYKAIEPLQDKTDCVLWQLPGNFHYNKEKLENFGEACSNDFVNVLEFRHSSWFNEECYDLLSNHNLAFCMISTPENDLPEVAKKTVGTTYLRFHGKGNEWYHYEYSKAQLRRWVDKIKEIGPSRIFVYFNNDYNAHAIKNARQLKDILGQ